MQKTLLITGWLGYIGSHAVVEFEKVGYKTAIVDNLSNSKLEVLDKIEKILWYKPKFYKVDLLDKNWLEQVFKENNFDRVIHFAWLKAVGESCEKPLLYFQNNITWSLNLFELMEKYWVKNIIFSSSATVYNLQKNVWEWSRMSENNRGIFENDLFEIVNWDVVLKRGLKETDPTWNTTNPYWRTKYLLEEILKDLAKFSGFNVIALRYFNPIWAHPTWLLWEDPNWIPNNLMPYIMKVLKWELKYLRVFWGDYPTVDGTGVRDYIDVMDLIDWHIQAYLRMSENDGGMSENEWRFDVFNLWVWRGISVLEMIKAVEQVSWKKVSYEIVDRRPGDLAMVYCNADKAKNYLNWRAKTSLEKSIENMLKFYSLS